MKLYYAHSVGIYNSEQEKRDIIQLLAMGFEVYNPNNEEVQEDFAVWRIANENRLMVYFDQLLDECDGVAFRAHPDGKIGSGIWYEINYARKQGKPIIELPNLVSTRALSVEDTREYLKILGNR